MKVAILIDAWLPFLGGGQKNVLEVTKILNKEYGADFKIFHSWSSNFFARILWCFYVIPQFIIIHFLFDKFDLIDARAFLAGFPGKIISIVLKIPIVYTVNGCGNLDSKKKNFSFLIEKFLLTGIKYDQEISDSQHFLQYTNINKNIKIIPNGVNVEEFDQTKVKKEKIFTLFYAGRLAKIKGPIYLLKAIKEVIKKENKIILKIAGVGPEEKRLKAYVNKERLWKYIKFLGMCKGKKLIEAFKSAHLFVLPSLAEGQPITLLEAWGAQLPVIVTNVGSIKYFVNSKNGYLIKPRDYQTLAKKILTAMRNKKLFILGQNGYQLVKKKYSWKNTAENYLFIYKKLLTKH